MWAVVAVAGAAQLAVLWSAMLRRWLYPYDLEWMEGGTLAHAARIAAGAGIYQRPSVDFIPFLYTPLYPGVLAALSGAVGISYAVARAVSIASIAGVLAVVATSIVRGSERRHRWPAVAGALAAGGLIAAAYPVVDGWYDIARADSLFLVMALGGAIALWRWSAAGSGWRGHARVAGAAALLALSFFCKQTGVLYVAAGGAIVAATAWRRLPTYVATAGAIGLGGTWLLDRATGGWFWTYVFEVHQAHDCNHRRFVDSFGAILAAFPIATAVIAVGLAAVAAAWIARRQRPPSAGPLLVWAWLYAVSCAVGAVGFATQWAEKNAYAPAFIAGAAAAGAALPAMAGALSALAGARRWACAAALAAGFALAGQLYAARWSPSAFVPTEADRRAGDALIAWLRSIDGDVLIPFHPWYAHLAGKPVYVHRMGVMDVSHVNHSPPNTRCVWARGRTPRNPPPWPIAGLERALRDTRFAAIVWDNRDRRYFPDWTRWYRPADDVPRHARPRTFTGARVVPLTVWVPARPVAPPPGARVLWNFEDGTFGGWTATGTAWGRGPTSRRLPGQKGTVRNYLGRYYVSSMHGGDAAVGTLTSPEFTIRGARITFRISGGSDASRLRAELWVDGKLVDQATSSADSERMTVAGWNVAHLRGRRAKIVLVDRARGPWGHLNADEFWEHDGEP
ncbi:MAG: hypothetical protein D6689_20350 [Deltaproteobacteria bacterium]|nr:MAG: hypothetical protein D6689_20350 [Deltaproteobacteria bacterium]